MSAALLARLVAGEDLSAAEAGDLLGVLLDVDVPDARKGALLAALATKGETPDEVRGLAQAMRAAAVAVPWSGDAVDTCGTGGDGSDSVNVSTAAALVVAACGVPVVKHGNRSVSSRSGSADVIEALGIAPCTTAESARASLVDAGFAFLFAPAFHPATAAVVPVRRALGVRTVFNLLGPITNPASPPFQLVGAWSPAVARLLAAALAGMGLRRAQVVHGDPGWDEATPCGPFLLLDVVDGRVTERTVDPAQDLGIPRCAPGDLAGGDASDNAAILRALADGATGPVRDAVVLNAGLVLALCGRAPHAADGIRRAQDALDAGRVRWLLDRLVARAEA